MLNKFSLSVPYSNVWRAVYRTFVQKRNGKIKENDDKCFALVKGSNIIVIFMIIIAIFFVCQTEWCKFKKKRHWLDENLVSEIQTNNLTENLVFLTDIIKRKIIDLNWKKKKSDIVKTSLSVNILKEYITLMTSASDDIPKFMANKKDKRKRATFYFTLWRTY